MPESGPFPNEILKNRSLCKCGEKRKKWSRKSYSSPGVLCVFFDAANELKCIEFRQSTEGGKTTTVRQLVGSARWGKGKICEKQVRIISIITKFNHNTGFCCFVKLGYVTGWPALSFSQGKSSSFLKDREISKEINQGQNFLLKHQCLGTGTVFLVDLRWTRSLGSRAVTSCISTTSGLCTSCFSSATLSLLSFFSFLLLIINPSDRFQ